MHGVTREKSKGSITDLTNGNSPKIAVIDYGAGNLHSVLGALARARADAFVADNAQALSACDGIILPGVGAFGYAADKLRQRKLTDALCGCAADGVPLLGICLGMQLLFETGEESPNARGLGLLNGEVTLLHANGLKAPHMGWTSLHVCGGKLMRGVSENAFAYFVHSYGAHGDTACATACYGETFDAAVECGNIFGTQFHPEKSSDTGRRILENFLGVCAEYGGKTTCGE